MFSSNAEECIICLEECTEPLYCCNAYIHVECARRYIYSVQNKGKLLGLSCPHCRSLWYRRLNFDPRRYAEPQASHALQLLANADQLQYQPFPMSTRSRVPTSTSVEPQPSTSEPQPSTSEPQPSTSEPSTSEPQASTSAEGTFGPLARGDRLWGDQSPFSPSLLQEEEEEDDFFLDLEVPSGSDIFDDEEEDYISAFEAAQRIYRGDEVVRALNMQEGEVVDLEEDLSIRLVNGRLEVIQ